MNEIEELLGKAAYETYYETLGDKNHFWEGIAYAAQDSWKAVAVRLIEIHEGARIQKIAEDGFGGMLPTGEIVDRRVHPDAIPLKANAELSIPEPQAKWWESVPKHTGEKCSLCGRNRVIDDLDGSKICEKCGFDNMKN